MLRRLALQTPLALCLTPCLARQPTGLAAPVNSESGFERVLVADVGELKSSVPAGQKPRNGFVCLNNTWGKGSLLNKKDFFSRWSYEPARFPQGSLLEFSYSRSTGAGFISSYPEIILGGGNYGDNIYTPEIGPWRNIKARDISELVVTYEVDIAGNVGMFDVLSDIYFTKLPNSSNGAVELELSFFPHNPAPIHLSRVSTFSGAGRCAVYRAPNSTQLQITPIDRFGGARDVLAGSVDLREMVNWLIKNGMLTGEEYIRGAEFGVETFNPGVVSWTSGLAQGSMLVKKLCYDWDGQHYG